VTSFESELRMLLKTGKVALGSRKAIKAALLGKAKLIILAENAPEDIRNDVLRYEKLSNIPV